MDSDPGYALQKLELAVLDLATGRGDVRSRLNSIFRDHLHVLRDDDFPDRLKPEWTWIWRKVTSTGPLIGPNGVILLGSVEMTLKRMRNSTGSEIAKRIVTLSEMLRSHLKDLSRRQ